MKRLWGFFAAGVASAIGAALFVWSLVRSGRQPTPGSVDPTDRIRRAGDRAEEDLLRLADEKEERVKEVETRYRDAVEAIDAKTEADIARDSRSPDDASRALADAIARGRARRTGDR